MVLTGDNQRTTHSDRSRWTMLHASRWKMAHLHGPSPSFGSTIRVYVPEDSFVQRKPDTDVPKLRPLDIAVGG